MNGDLAVGALDVAAGAALRDVEADAVEPDTAEAAGGVAVDVASAVEEPTGGK
jgi:hypothetical protein